MAVTGLGDSKWSGVGSPPSPQPLLQALVKSRPAPGVDAHTGHDSPTPRCGLARGWGSPQLLGTVAPPLRHSSDSGHLSQHDAGHRGCRARTPWVPGHRQTWQNCPGDTGSLLLLSHTKDPGTRAAGARRHLILPCPLLGGRPHWGPSEVLRPGRAAGCFREQRGWAHDCPGPCSPST